MGKRLHQLRVGAGSGRLTGIFWSSVWLIYLVIPLIGVWTSAVARPTQIGITALTVLFAGVYVANWVALIGYGVGRWRWPGAAVLLALAMFGAIVGAPFGLGYLFCYAGAAVAIALVPRFRIAILAVAGIVALTAVIGLALHEDLWSVVLQVMITASGGGAALGFTAIHVQNDRLREAHEEIARLAVAEERLRFSRDLHDLLGHSLSVIVLKAELAHRMAERSPERTASEVADIERVARGALREVREAVAGYRQPSLSAELDGATRTLRQAGIQVLVRGHAGSLPGAQDGALAWAVREATTNVIRHTHSRRVQFEITREAVLLRLRVVNDGPAAPTSPAAGGNGLRGLGERLHAVGGGLDYGPGVVDGFVLSATVPLAVTDPAAHPVA